MRRFVIACRCHKVEEKQYFCQKEAPQLTRCHKMTAKRYFGLTEAPQFTSTELLGTKATPKQHFYCFSLRTQTINRPFFQRIIKIPISEFTNAQLTPFSSLISTVKSHLRLQCHMDFYLKHFHSKHLQNTSAPHHGNSISSVY